MKQYLWPLYFTLFGLTAWHIAYPGSHFTSSLGSHAPAQEELCQFDSFSEPAIAAAILRQEAERLLGDYLQTDPHKLDFEPGSSCPTNSSKPALGHCPMEGSPSIAAIQNLQKEVHALDSEMDRKLMVIYLRQKSWNDCLDCYLHFLHTEPQSAFVLICTRSALICCENCDRSEEVLDALRHFIRFHRELKSTQTLRAMIEQWKTRQRNPDVDDSVFKKGDQ